jgi:hypothetical protein
MRWSRVCAADAISAAPRLRRDRVRWGMATAAGSAPERGDGGEGAVSSVCLRLRRLSSLLYSLAPRLPRG